MTNFWNPLAPLLGEIWICVRRVFCKKFNSKQFFKVFCNIIVLFAAFHPKVNLLTHSDTLYLKNGNLWSPLAPLLREMEICFHWVFCRKSNSKQVYFNMFFDIIGIFFLVFSLNPPMTISLSDRPGHFFQSGFWPRAPLTIPQSHRPGFFTFFQTHFRP